MAVTLSMTLLTSSALARYDQVDATRDCERAILDAYGHQEFYGEKHENQDHDSFKISGKVRVRHGDDGTFSCRVKHREVVSFKLHDQGEDKGDDAEFDSTTAAAVGAGVLGLAVLGALAGADGDDAHAQTRSRYGDDPNSDPLSNRDYLEEECRRTLMDHIQHDHGSVDRLAFEHVYLDERELRGQGDVGFRLGGDRRFEFSCRFDRQGRIHDGDYRYY